MRVLPKHDELVWEVTSAGAKLPDGFDLETWLERLSRALASGEIDIPELGLAMPRYPNSGYEPPVYENVTDLVLGYLLPHGHKPLLDLLDALEREYRQQAAAIFLALLVIYADRISDLESARAAFEGLETPASAPYAYIKAALQQLAREQGGRAPKKKEGIYRLVVNTVAQQPAITPRQLWESIPAEDDQDPLTIGEYDLYRAKGATGELLVQVDAKGGERTLAYPTFRRYVAMAKNRLPLAH